MEKAIQITCSFLMLMLFACTDKLDSVANQECIDHFLAEFNMVAYNGEDLQCADFYLVLYEHKGSKFALLHNDCADLYPQLLTDCDGNELCTYTTEEGCFEMVKNADNLGIIGVEGEE